MRLNVILAFGVIASFPMAATAQEDAVSGPACLCAVSLEASGKDRVATLEDVDGQVLAAGELGYALVRSGTGLAVGDRVILMNDGRALLRAGAACRVRIGSPSLVSVVAQQGSACIARNSLAAAGETEQPGSLTILAGIGVLAGMGAFLAGRAAEDSPPVSP